MISQSISASASAPLSFCPCKIDGLQNQRVSNLFFLSCGKRERVVPWKKISQPKISVFVCSFPTSGRDSNLNLEVANSVAARGAKSFVVKTFSKEFEEEEEEELSQQSSSNIHVSRRSNNFNSFQEDPIVYNLRTQLGVIHPMPSPQINRNIVGLFVFFFFVGVAFDKIWSLRKRKKSTDESRLGAWPQVPTSFSLFLEKDLQRKESVEWVNMVLGKLWKVYRAEIENWIIGLLQPIIDNLKKPDYVQRVEIKQFSLGDEPLSVRNVERRTSRRDNDLQYQIGLRYTGGARMLLMLSLKFSVIPIVVPVGVRDFDIDGELWVKLRLIASQPWVGAASWAFVSLPKIKFELSPFRLFNIMAIPVLSMFLTKLLTEDLPRLFVRPKKIVLDFQKGKAVGPVPNDLKTGELIEGSKDFVGELSVTLVDARNLSYIFYGKTDPYVTLSLGDQLIRSKKNSQTTITGPPGKPIWNQDFHMLVTNPRKQKLYIQVKDSLGFADLRVGTGEVDIASLEDTVPTDRIVVLRGGWGLFGKGSAGEILLRLTYKAYVEDEEDEKTEVDTDDELSDSDESDSRNERDFSGVDKESFMDVLAAFIISEKFQGIVSSETGKSFEDSKNVVSRFSKTSSKAPVPGLESSASILDTGSKGSRGSPLVLLTVITSLALLISLSLGGSNLFNP